MVNLLIQLFHVDIMLELFIYFLPSVESQNRKKIEQIQKFEKNEINEDNKNKTNFVLIFNFHNPLKY